MLPSKASLSCPLDSKLIEKMQATELEFSIFFSSSCLSAKTRKRGRVLSLFPAAFPPSLSFKNRGRLEPREPCCRKRRGGQRPKERAAKHAKAPSIVRRKKKSDSQKGESATGFNSSFLPGGDASSSRTALNPPLGAKERAHVAAAVCGLATEGDERAEDVERSRRGRRRFLRSCDVAAAVLLLSPPYFLVLSKDAEPPTLLARGLALRRGRSRGRKGSCIERRCRCRCH